MAPNPIGNFENFYGTNLIWLLFNKEADKLVVKNEQKQYSAIYSK